jgi:hypothetical protein
MEQYMLKALTKLRKEIPRRYKDLRAVCDETIGNLHFDAMENYSTDVFYFIALFTEAEAGKIKITKAGKYFEPLKLACESRLPRLMEIGLDAIHFLIGKIILYAYQLLLIRYWNNLQSMDTSEVRLQIVRIVRKKLFPSIHSFNAPVNALMNMTSLFSFR